MWDDKQNKGTSLKQMHENRTELFRKQDIFLIFFLQNTAARAYSQLQRQRNVF